MSWLPLLRSRDPLAALLALAVLALIIAGPPRNLIRMKDKSRPITISLAAPEETPPAPTPPRPQPPEPPRPPPPKAVQSPPKPIVPRAEEIAKPAEPAVPATPAPPAPPVERVVPPAPPAPPRPAPPTPPATAKPANVEAAYVAKLRAYLESIKRYPTTREARSMRPQGHVRVWLEIDRAGALRNAGIDESSGSMILDGAALATVRQGTYPPFPDETWSGQSTHRFEVTLEYSLEG
jgi:protein TonB